MWALVNAGSITKIIKYDMSVSYMGNTYIGWTSWTEEERNNIGIYSVINNPAITVNYNEKRTADTYAIVDGLVYRSQNKSTLTVEQLQDKEAIDKIKWKGNIDQVAGNARSSYVSKGDLTADEYLHAYNKAVEFIDSGYIGTAPKSVTSWAAANDTYTTNTQAADNIKALGDLYYNKLDDIREQRLLGKYNVDNASQDAIKTAGLTAIAALEALYA